MSRKQCRRKVWGLVNPLTYVLDGIQVTPTHLLDKLRMIELSSIEAFARGHATKSDWDAMADMLNVCEVMGSQGIGPEALEACARAQHGLQEAQKRFKETGRMGLSGPAIQAMRDLYEFHDLQRTSITRGEYEGWIQQTRNRIRSAHPSLKVTT